MGSIVSFMPRRATVHRAPRTAEASASIIIFPGVRYERTGGTTSSPDNRVEGDNRRKDPLPRH
ncbi:hypothetical protein CO731_04416 [Aminobacter sp. MSH1]|uniref:Uncharacterized protein n=2 Tax=Phyllobacteriaceae TaxID=69277 RepID=A0ABR6L4U8_9HYPH|nr:hypothetical protein [Aminobacter sp. MSH1]AWC24924.1 hypothetical protein CO731_04416 [Aminobacter sp. MSH1]MBB4651830.1 hypothetical protein [Aminobacter niigataensis]